MNVLVIGAGPAGLAAAIFARRGGADVLLVERNAQCGAKLLATGGGHCNAANLRPPSEWPALFGKNGRFILPALEFLPREKLEAWFRALGEPLAAEDGFHLFPESRSAKRVRDALRREAEEQGVAIRTGAFCESVLVREGAAAGAVLRAAGAESADSAGAAAESVFADAVVLATGGAVRPATGSDWSGCRIAAALGHRVAPPVQGLVGLRTASVSPALAGLALPDARVAFKAEGKREEAGRGELLLTHTGISGPAVLDLSASVCAAVRDRGGAQTVRIRWCGDADAAAWRERFDGWRRTDGGKTVAALLRGQGVPQRLAGWLCEQAGAADGAAAAGMTAAARDCLAGLLGDFPAVVTGGEGMDRAMITRGGVDVRDVSPETLESRRVRRLHFAGEMLDVDGPCGGYNLHWAFAGGALAGASAGRTL